MFICLQFFYCKATTWASVKQALSSFQLPFLIWHLSHLSAFLKENFAPSPGPARGQGCTCWAGVHPPPRLEFPQRPGDSLSAGTAPSLQWTRDLLLILCASGSAVIPGRMEVAGPGLSPGQINVFVRALFLTSVVSSPGGFVEGN